MCPTQKFPFTNQHILIQMDMDELVSDAPHLLSCSLHHF